MASHDEETASDRERRRARRRARRAERHAKRSSASPVKANATDTTYSNDDDDDAEKERVRQTEEVHPRKGSALKQAHMPTDLYSPPKSASRSMPAKSSRDNVDNHDSDHEYYQRGHTRRPTSDEGHPRMRSDHRHQRDDHHRRDRRDRPQHGREHRSHHSRPSYHHRSSSDKDVAAIKTKEIYGESEERKSQRWSRKRICIIVAISIILIIIIAVAAAKAAAKKHPFKYTPSYEQVTNTTAFTNGGASKDANNTKDGLGGGTDKYVYFSGPASNFPRKEEWVSFADMWQANQNVMLNSCKLLRDGRNNNDGEMTDIYNAIQSRASASLVDHRFILAVIMQESHGCVRIPTSQNGVRNPGLMQSHNGASFSSSAPSLSILQMVQDGTQGTASGPGLVQLLNSNGNAYEAARLYNSGTIAAGGDLSDGMGAMACYVSDIANRLTGWVYANSTCPS